MKDLRPMVLVVAVVFSAVALLVLADAPAHAQRGADREDRREPPNFRDMTDEQREALRQRFEERAREMRNRQQEQLREQLEMTAEEFALVNPMVERIRRLQGERQTAMWSGRGGGRGGFGPDAGPSFAERFGIERRPEPSEAGRALQEAVTQLRAALDDESTEADALSARLEAVRQARRQLDQSIAGAQAELRGVLLTRQEAVLVMQGVLE